MNEFDHGLTKAEKERYNQLIKKSNQSIDFDKIKRIQTDITLLKEKGITRLKANKPQ